MGARLFDATFVLSYVARLAASCGRSASERHSPRGWELPPGITISREETPCRKHQGYGSVREPLMQHVSLSLARIKGRLGAGNYK